MRISFMMLAPAVVIAALPAFAQSTVTSSESTTTSTTEVAPAPVETETITKSVRRTGDYASPAADGQETRSYEQKTTTESMTGTETRSTESSVTKDADGYTSESRTTTTQTDTR